MNVLEGLHVLADHEQSLTASHELLRVFDRFTGSWVHDPERQLHVLACFGIYRNSVEVEIVVAGVVRVGRDQRHAATRALCPVCSW